MEVPPETVWFPWPWVLHQRIGPTIETLPGRPCIHARLPDCAHCLCHRQPGNEHQDHRPSPRGLPSGTPSKRQTIQQISGSGNRIGLSECDVQRISNIITYYNIMNSQQPPTDIASAKPTNNIILYDTVKQNTKTYP